MGVWHRMSRQHLQRYLDEIGFRWNCRLKREIITKKERRRRIVTTIHDMLSRLLKPATGRQIRRTANCVWQTFSPARECPSPLVKGLRPIT